MEEHWILPCNIRIYDVVQHFKRNKRIVWINSFSMKTGDIAYLYVASPFSEIKYECVVLNDQVDEVLLKENPYVIPKKQINNFYIKKIKYVELELVSIFPEGTFTLAKLREHGLGQVQIQARADRDLKSYLTEIKALIST